jgi:hypothetical protein
MQLRWNLLSLHSGVFERFEMSEGFRSELLEKQRALRDFFNEMSCNALSFITEVEQFIIDVSEEGKLSEVEPMVYEIFEIALDRFGENRAMLRLMREGFYGRAWRYPDGSTSAAAAHASDAVI